MLTIDRKSGESIYIVTPSGDTIEVKYFRTKNYTNKLCVTAPPEYAIHRNNPAEVKTC